MSELTEKQKIEKAINDAEESLKAIMDKDERLEIQRRINTNYDRLRQLEANQIQAAAAQKGN
jgi:hypothetical protein